MKALFMTLGLMTFCLTASAEPVSSTALTNTKAVAEAETLFFGNTTGKIERLEFHGQLTTGEACTVSVRKTRWGIYFGILTSVASGTPAKYIETGVTLSGYTTQNLEFINEPANGALHMSRIGVTNMDERGQDTSADKLELSYLSDASQTHVTKITVQVAPLDVYYDPRSGVPTYSPSGKLFEKTCVVN